MSDKNVIRRITTPEDRAQAQEDRQRAKALAGDGTSTILVQEDDPRYQAALAQRKCEHCAHFNQELSLQSMHEQQFVERIVRDDKWQENWFEDWEKYGICEVFSDGGGSRTNSPNAPAICAASDLDSSLGVGTKEGSVMVPCPYYLDRRAGRIMSSSKAGVRGPTKRDTESRRYAREHDARRRRGEILQ